MTIVSGSATVGGVALVATAALTLPGPVMQQRGSLPVGQATYPVPAQAVFISPSGSDLGAGSLSAPKATLRAAMVTAPAGGVIVCRAGVYREGNWITSKPVTVQAYPGEVVWFDGSRPATQWTRSGNVWVTPYATKLPRFDASRFGSHQTISDMGNVPDQCFYGDTEQTQVRDKTPPGAGQFSVDQDAGTLTVGTDPTGKDVEVSVHPTFIAAGAPLNLLGIGVRRYSPTSAEGFNAAIYYGGTSQGSRIENVTIRQSSMSGLQVTKDDMVVNHVTIEDCHYTGMFGAKCNRLTFTNSIIRRVNRLGWPGSPATGGVKFTRSAEIRIDNVLIQDTPGCAAFWLDVSTRATTFANCVADGASPIGAALTGYNIESSDGGVVSGVERWNYLANCLAVGGHKFAVQIQSSGYTKVYNCDFGATLAALNIQQTYDGNPGGNPDNLTAVESPWRNSNIQIVNNRLHGPALQIISFDDSTTPRSLGADMITRIAGNWFDPAPPGSMVQLGKVDGYRTSYNSLAALALADASVGGPLGVKLGTNYQGSQPPASPVADPIPSDVAAAIGRPTLTGQRLTGIIPD